MSYDRRRGALKCVVTQETRACIKTRLLNMSGSERRFRRVIDADDV